MDLDKSICLGTTNWSVHIFFTNVLPAKSSAFRKNNCKYIDSSDTFSEKKTKNSKAPKIHLLSSSLSVSQQSKQAKMKHLTKSLNTFFFFFLWLVNRWMYSLNWKGEKLGEKIWHGTWALYFPRCNCKSRPLQIVS